MSAGLPCGGVHKDGSIQSHDILVQLHHTLPPILFDVVLQFHTILTIIIHGAQAIINLTAGEHETVLLAMGNDFLEDIFLLCHNLYL